MENLDFSRPAKSFKGNPHSASSDGRLHPGKGYDFLVPTDHFGETCGFGVTDTRTYRTSDFTTIIGAELYAPETEAGEIWHIKSIGLLLDFEPLRENETGPGIAWRAWKAGAFIGMVHPTW